MTVWYKTKQTVTQQPFWQQKYNSEKNRKPKNVSDVGRCGGKKLNHNVWRVQYLFAHAQRFNWLLVQHTPTNRSLWTHTTIILQGAKYNGGTPRKNIYFVVYYCNPMMLVAWHKKKQKTAGMVFELSLRSDCFCFSQWMDAADMLRETRDVTTEQTTYLRRPKRLSLEQYGQWMRRD